MGLSGVETGIIKARMGSTTLCSGQSRSNQGLRNLRQVLHLCNGNFLWIHRSKVSHHLSNY